MKVRAPLHSLDARGRFGVGIVFSIWKGMSTARLFTVPVNPRSTRQTVIRAFLAAASRAWSGLTDANRTSFNEYANDQNRKNVFGQDQKVSGYNEYCALYVMASDVGETPVSTAPATAAPIAVDSAVIEGGAGNGEIDVDWSASQGGYVDIWITEELNVGREPQESDYAHDSYTADATETKTISGLTAGGMYGVRCRQVFANGQVGPWTSELLAATSGA